MKYRLLTIFLFSLTVQQVFGQDNLKIIDSILNKLYLCDKLNGNVLIAEKGQIVYKKSFGLANEATKSQLNDSSIFELASVSKQFTAMGIMILEEHGKLKLDDKISKYLPEFSIYPNITTRNLLNHTGGLPDYLKLMDSVWDKSKIAANKNVITFFTKYHPNALFKPNTKFDYSNTGYVLLASIIEKCSGMSYPQFLKKEIFEPLGMNHTLVYRRRYAPMKIDNYAFGYQYSEQLKKYILPDSIEQSKFVIWLDGVYGDGAVNSTTIDLLKWDRALYTDKLISKESLIEMFKPAILNDGTQTDYGFGWSLDSSADFGKVVSHYGGWPGYASYIERDITNDKTIIILTNHYNRINYVQTIENALYNKPLPRLSILKEIYLPVDRLKKFEGTYLQDSEEIKIFIENGHLYYQQSGQNKLLLTPQSEQSFFVKIFNDTEIEFVKDEKDEIAYFILSEGDEKYKAIKKQ